MWIIGLTNLNCGHSKKKHHWCCVNCQMSWIHTVSEPITVSGHLKVHHLDCNLSKCNRCCTFLSWLEKQVNWSTVPWKATSAQVVRQQLSSIRLWKDLWSHSRRIMLEGFVDLSVCYVKGSSGQSEQVVTEAIWHSSCCRTMWSWWMCSGYTNAVPSNESSRCRLDAKETLTGWPKAKNRAGVPLWEAKQSVAKWLMKHELLGHLGLKKKKKKIWCTVWSHVKATQHNLSVPRVTVKLTTSYLWLVVKESK